MKENYLNKKWKTCKISECGAVQRNAHLVELEICFKNAPTLAIVAVHTDEYEPSRVQVKKNEITCTQYLIPRQDNFI